uniref:Uncharacterized protein n=1 Tax=Microcebus murinus TaxID=30608 RepID=A0A8C6ELP2_MICMU
MALWSLALGALLLVMVLYLCLPGLLRQRGPQEPPLDKGTVPWLGHAMAFQKNMFGFLKRMWTKHGDVFTVQLAGQYFTFVMDPLSFGPILKETQKKLDFSKFAKRLVRKMFGYYTKGENKPKMLLASSKYLMGHELEDLNEACLALCPPAARGLFPQASLIVTVLLSLFPLALTHLTFKFCHNWSLNFLIQCIVTLPAFMSFPPVAAAPSSHLICHP